MYQATTSIRLRRIHFCFWLLGALLLSANPLQAAQVLYPGAILIVSAADGTNSSGALFVVNPTNGDRSLLSDFGNPAQGPLANRDIVGVALNWNGAIYVSTLFSGSDGFGAIFEVNPQNGNRTIVVDFGQGELQGYPYYGLAEDVLGNLFANLYSGTPPYPATVARVNPRTDNRAFVSNFDDSTVSAQFITDVALGQFGQIVVESDTQRSRSQCLSRSDLSGQSDNRRTQTPDRFHRSSSRHGCRRLIFLYGSERKLWTHPGEFGR